MERVLRRCFLQLTDEGPAATRLEQLVSSTRCARRKTLRVLGVFLGGATALKPTILHTPTHSSVTTIDLFPELTRENLAAPAEAAVAPQSIPIEPPVSPQPQEQTPSDPPEQKLDIITYAMQQAVRAGLEPLRFVKAIRCESGFQPWARSRDGQYHGLMQYDNRTWAEALAVYKRAARIPDDRWAAMEKNIYDPHFHIDVTVMFIRHLGGYSRWPNC